MHNNNKNTQSNRYLWNVDRTDFQHDLPVDPQFGYFQQMMPMYNPQFLWAPQMPSFPLQQQPQQQQLQHNLIHQYEPPVKIEKIESCLPKLEKDAQKETRNKINKAYAKSKRNLKNTYINKINELKQDNLIEVPILQQTSQIPLPTTPKEISIKNDRQPIEEKVNCNLNKLERNRECAKNSRKRKKIYIELLEKKMKCIEVELEHAKSEATSQYNGYNNQSDFFLRKENGVSQVYVDQMEEQTQPQILQDAQRQTLLKLLSAQMINVNLPNHLTFLLAACNNKDEVVKQQMKDVVQDLGLTKQQQDKVLNFISTLTLTKSKLTDRSLLVSMKHIVKQLFNEYHSIQDIIQTSLLQPLGHQNFEYIVEFFQKNEEKYDFESVFHTFKDDYAK